MADEKLPLNASQNKPEEGVVYVEVSGLTGTGKSAVMGEIEIALRAIGLPVEHDAAFAAEKRMTHADWQRDLELYKPRVVIRERNIPRPTVPDDVAGGEKAPRLKSCITYTTMKSADVIQAQQAEITQLREALTRLLREAELDGMESRAGWDCWMHLARVALYPNGEKSA